MRSPIESGFKRIAVYCVLLSIVPAIRFGVVVVKAKSFGVDNNKPGEAHADQLPDNICTTPSCNLTAARVLLNMDKDVEPCDDFYGFACGGFLKNTVVDDNSTHISTVNLINEKTREKVKTILEEPSPPMEPKPFKLAKNLYKSCMNKTAIEAQGHTPLLRILEKLGGWPVLEKDLWNEETFNWIELNYKLWDLRIFPFHFINFDIFVDLKNNTKRVINLDQASLGLSHEYLTKGLNDTIVKAYYEYMVDIAVILGAEQQFAEKEMLSSLEFEMKLADISLPQDKLQNATLLYNPMTIAQLSMTYPSIPWKEYFNHVFSPSIQVDDSEVVIVQVPSFITSLEKVMKDTPKRIQANYVMWRIAKSLVFFLNDDLRKRQLQYSTAYTGIKTRSSRWVECIEIVSGSLSISVGALYVRKYFHEEAKMNVIEMVENIRKQFKLLLEKADWIDNETRKSALEKAASMTSHIAYPEELLDDSKLEELYHNLEISDDNYFQGIINSSFFEAKYGLSRLREPVNNRDWVIHGDTTTVNAFYFRTENSIELPAGILQGVFFSNDRPRYMNYGAIGFMIGHEIAHGFDDRGHQFDEEGNLVDWWAPSTKEKYLAKVQCIIDQYGNYTVEEVKMKLNGTKTRGENIADNGGMKIAYLAYNDWLARNGQEQLLPGLPYTQRQMFWISAANIWCSVYPPEILKERIMTDVHSPHQFRISGPLSNMPEFAEDFKCPVGSKMNPKNKCAVW